MTGATQNNTGGNRPHGPAGTTRRERAFVLAGLGLAAAVTLCAFLIRILAPQLADLSPGADVLAALWFAAVAWTVAATIVHAFWLGFRRGDWSAFGGHRFPEDGESLDWSSQTGSYAWMRIAEEHERLMRADDGDAKNVQNDLLGIEDEDENE